MRIPRVLLLLVCLFSQLVSVSSQPATHEKFKGFLGTYHPYNGTAYGGFGWSEGELMQKAFDFGQNAILVKGSHLKYTFEENIRNSCTEWDVNQMYGIILPPSESGLVNQPADSDLWKPLDKNPGMVQAAHRFSELSKMCPQITGVIIDDLYNDFPKAISLDDLKDIKGALVGKRLDENGKVDQASPATTPDLKLYFVVYEHHLKIDPGQAVLDLIDGVCFWTWKQSEHYTQFDENIDTVHRLYPNKDVIAGVYVRHSREVPSANSVRNMIEHAVQRYDQGSISGVLLFSAIWLSREESKRERWEELALPQLLDRVYYSHLGERRGRVVDAKTGGPVENAVVSVFRLAGGTRQLITRKRTDGTGEYRFGGWAGSSKKGAAYRIEIRTPVYETRTADIKMSAGSGRRVLETRLTRR